MRVPAPHVARVFLELGVTSFGGPAAHIALMHDQLVRRRGWITDAEFTDLLAATNLIPGPNSTEMALHIGHRVAGLRGFLAAGVCFTLPGILIVGVLAHLYVAYSYRADARVILAGIAPVMIAVVAQAVWRLAEISLRTVRAGAIATSAAVGFFLGIPEVPIILGAGVVASGAAAWRAAAVLVGTCATPAVAQAAAAAAVPLADLGLFFLKVGSILFGSGYVLVAFLRADLVERWHLLTDAQLLDAIAAGQVTPGPLFTTATFIGYMLAGVPGAIVSTAAIFAPAFVFVLMTQPLIPRLRASRAAAAFLDGAAAASLGLMAAVTIQLLFTSVTDMFSAVIAAAATLGLIRWNPNALWVIVAGALAGVLRHLIQQ